MRIKNLEINPPLFLAPMAGITHSAFRRLLLHYGGVGLLTTEMLAARRLPAENPAVSPYLFKTEEEYPLCYQLLLSDPSEVEMAVATLHRLGAQAIDLNMGCPAPKVRRSGGGSQLMETPERVRRIVAAIRRATDLPVTAKIRLGERLDAGYLRNFCCLLEGEGIDLLTVHARLRGELFCRKPRWEWVGEVKQWVRIPVVANGGIFNLEDARECLRRSGADGLMLGRGAVQRPWLFRDIAAGLFGLQAPCCPVQLPELYGRFVDNLAAFRPERRLGRLKEFTRYFAQNYQFGHQLTSAVQSSEDLLQAIARAGVFFKEADPGAAELFAEAPGSGGPDGFSAKAG